MLLALNVGDCFIGILLPLVGVLNKKTWDIPMGWDSAAMSVEKELSLWMLLYARLGVSLMMSSSVDNRSYQLF